ncbi:uncharacterized protein [Cebidichthys violaceus]|uniref:uncharacterized protein n=1 Tax=Cebidichthys violaceus TaxID=271503 RepID=UPI0035CAC951
MEKDLKRLDPLKKALALFKRNDSSQGRTEDFKETLSEPFKKPNLSPSSDEDLCSDSGVFFKSDISNDRLINFPLRERLKKALALFKRNDSSQGRTEDFKETLSEPFKKPNLSPSSDEDLCSDSGVFFKSDISNDRLINFPLRDPLKKALALFKRNDSSQGRTEDFKETLSEPFKKPNLSPSSDEDLCSDSGVFFKSDISNDRLINFPLRRRRHQELSSPPSGAQQMAQLQTQLQAQQAQLRAQEAQLQAQQAQLQAQEAQLQAQQAQLQAQLGKFLFHWF